MKYTTIAIAIILAVSANAQWTVVNLHPAGAIDSHAFGVTVGEQVGYASFPNSFHAGRWSGTAASWVQLHPTGSATSYALGVHGSQQVGYSTVGNHASLWSGTAGSWVDLTPAGATDSWAYGVHSGQQVGEVVVGGVFRASLWFGTAGSWVDMNPAGSSASHAWGTDGTQQVGRATFGGISHAGVWSGSAATWVDMHPAGASSSRAMGIRDGQQAGWATIGGVDHASVWSGSSSSWVDLHPAGSSLSSAYGVDSGQQVGESWINSAPLASLWYGTSASWIDLHAFLPVDFTRSQARGIWQDGALTYITGYGQKNTGRYNALMWVSRSALPTSFNMFRGSVFSGNLASLQNSDNNRLVMRPGITLGTSQPPIQIILNGTAPTASPNGFSFSLESSASFGNAQQKISLYNFNAGLYEELDARLAKTTDDTVTVTVRTNPSRFIQAGTLAIRALVSFRAVGPSLAFPWSGRLDKVWWNFPG